MEKTVIFSASASNGLPNGIYTVHVKQQLEPNCTIKDYHVQDATIKFQVSADTVVMSEKEVYSVYPPREAVGQFEDCIPHIVLHRRTLPWEYPLEIESNETLPYVALLVVSEDEPAVGKTTSFGQSKQVEQNVYVPQQKDLYMDETTTCRVVDFEKSFLMSILPTVEDLQYMAHVKGVDLENKVTDEEVKDAWFSCVLANRYPKEASGGASIRHTAYFVSLAGYEKWLTLSMEERAKCNDYDFFRMYVLYQWNFQVEPQSYDFYELANHLHANVYSVEEPVEEDIQPIINQGYVPIEHTFREGSQTISWYRSPFLPRRFENQPITSRYHVADELLRYDPELGMFDISYSAAWQLGRLMNLKNTENAKQLMSWRTRIKVDEVKRQNRMMLLRKLSNTNSSCNSIEEQSIYSENEWEKKIKRMVHACNDVTEE